MKNLGNLFTILFMYFLIAPVYAGNSSNPNAVSLSMSTTGNNLGSGVTANKPDTQMVNINQANLDQLEALKGVGAKKAQAIIDYRTHNGSFKSVDELTNVKGMSQKIIDANRVRLTIN